MAVDRNGNAKPVKTGEHITSSPNGDYQQVRGADGVETGVRMDRGGHPKLSDPAAQGPHGHRPDVPGTQHHLPINKSN